MEIINGAGVREKVDGRRERWKREKWKKTNEEILTISSEEMKRMHEYSDRINPSTGKPYIFWQIKYIEVASLLDKHYTIPEIAKIVGVHYNTIYAFTRDNPEVNDLIREKLISQFNKLGNMAIQALYERIRKSDKALQIALEITDIYTPKSEVTNRYDGLSREQKVEKIRRGIARLEEIEIKAS